MAELSLFFPNNKKTEYVKIAYEIIKMCWNIYFYLCVENCMRKKKSKEC